MHHTQDVAELVHCEQLLCAFHTVPSHCVVALKTAVVFEANTLPPLDDWCPRTKTKETL